MTKELELDKDLQNGPTRNRSITDCICCLIMLAFWAATIAVAIFALKNGNPWKLAVTYDRDNLECGMAENGTDAYKLAYFYQPLKNLTKIVCVDNCPQWKLNTTAPTSVGCYGKGTNKVYDINNCTSANTFSFNYLPERLIEFYQEDFLIYNTTAVLGRFCLPDSSVIKDAAKTFLQNVTVATQAGHIFEEYFADMKDSYKYILIVAGIAAGISIFFLIFIRCCAGLIVWIILFAFLGSIFALGILSGKESTRLKALSSTEVIDTTQSNTYYNATNLYNLSIFFYVLGGVSVIVILACMGAISLSIAVLKTAAMFVYSNFWIILIPLLTAIFIAAYMLLWIAVMLYLWTIGTSIQRTNTPFAEIVWDEKTRYIIIFHAFSFLWNVAFINYFGVFVIASSCVIWYFNQGKDSPNYFPRPILTSIWWGFRYHLGSLGFGAFILAIIWAIRIILMYLAHYVEELKKKGIESKVLDLFIKCLMCYVACFQRFVEYLSTMGFIQVAVSGKNFCRSCIDAFALIFQNLMKFGFVHFLGSAFVFIGEIFVAAFCGVVGYLMINYDVALSAKLYSKIVPVFIFIVLGYFIATIFFSIYGVSADTVIMSFFMDKELSKTSGRPVSAPEPMRDFYDKYKKEGSE
jgi:choline transporter-like protein 2/4/5